MDCKLDWSDDSRIQIKNVIHQFPSEDATPIFDVGSNPDIVKHETNTLNSLEELPSVPDLWSWSSCSDKCFIKCYKYWRLFSY